ncbi:MAG: hypothetical protein M3Y36_04975 [Actinomycetota bacterium]|nr:hypothetical protein [Actinomycetota bacterium]
MTFLEDYLVFVDEALNGMIAMVEEFEDELATGAVADLVARARQARTQMGAGTS